MTSRPVPTYDDVLAAEQRIRPHIHRTPVLTSKYFDTLSGARLFFKCENLQKTGAFKARGAVNAVFSLSDTQAAKGVATHSSGNHGQALCYAAARRGIAATVVMPHTAPAAKKAAVHAYGGTIIECAPTMASREATLKRELVTTGADLVHPYNDARVIAGQGTCAKELIEDCGPLDAVIAPIGGGGLISGTCLTIATIAPEVSVYGTEPAEADDALRSLKAGHIITEDAPETIADGLKASLKELTWYFVSRHVADIFTATEDEIVEAMRLVWERMKIVIEPSSAVTVAAVLKNRPAFAGARIGVILSGGNVDLDRLPWQQNH